MLTRIAASTALLLSLATTTFAIDSPATRPKSPGDEMLDRYFRAETAAIASRCLADIKTLDDWTSRRDEYRRQLADMLGLWPEPEKTDLKPVITGRLDHGDFAVEQLYFQSRPGLYVTANLYLPKNASGPSPAILYVCGHGEVKKDGISYGNKVSYQHHGEWFARNGYVCLIIDSLELGEINGIHHGLYRLGMWDWLSRGYTPAGVEAWNGIRAIDYLQSRPEVDPQRIGLSGRSGGGAYTWYIAALDERAKVVVPVAGITDLQNHIVDGCVEGHCDCMYMVNTYRWDFPQVAALIAPRPMLISNSDKDKIFPLDGVERLHSQVRRIFELYNAKDKLGLLITEGPHKDTQDLQVPAFRWFNRFLKNDTGPLKDATADKLLEPEQLKVLPPHEFPADSVNGQVQERFIATAPPPQVPESKEAWEKQRDAWMAGLKEKTFAGWPQNPPPLDVKLTGSSTLGKVRVDRYEFTSQENVRLRLFVARLDGASANKAMVSVSGNVNWATWVACVGTGFAQAADPQISAPQEKSKALLEQFVKEEAGGMLIVIVPRGIGSSAWTGDAKRRTDILRRFELLGQTLDGMRIWDVRRAIQAIHGIDSVATIPLRLEEGYDMAGVVLYASLFEPGIESLTLGNLAESHLDGPALLNVLKTLDVPSTVAMAAERCDVQLWQDRTGEWEFPLAVAAKLGWPAHRIEVIPPKPVAK